MRYRSFYVDTLVASGRPVPTMGGDLVVVDKEERGDLDWELITRSEEPHALEQKLYDVEISCPDGVFSGPAILVRSDGLTHVFRGVGELKDFVGFLEDLI